MEYEEKHHSKGGGPPWRTRQSEELEEGANLEDRAEGGEGEVGEATCPKCGGTCSKEDLEDLGCCRQCDHVESEKFDILEEIDAEREADWCAAHLNNDQV